MQQIRNSSAAGDELAITGRVDGDLESGDTAFLPLANLDDLRERETR